MLDLDLIIIPMMETDGMIVTNIIKGSPASSVLEVGDKFIMVNEVLVTKIN